MWDRIVLFPSVGLENYDSLCRRDLKFKIVCSPETDISVCQLNWPHGVWKNAGLFVIYKSYLLIRCSLNKSN